MIIIIIIIIINNVLIQHIGYNIIPLSGGGGGVGLLFLL